MEQKAAWASTHATLLSPGTRLKKFRVCL